MARGQSVMLGSSFKPKIEEQTKRLETFNKSIKTEDLGKEVPVVRVFPMKEFTASEEETEESNIESFHHYIRSFDKGSSDLNIPIEPLPDVQPLEVLDEEP
ncbi:uncharacterized protein LOC129958963 [Argiope bruennichi]|uniref:uncharacterized protein LOC129958963 n=1 Tax=Argiope bruennichi TaxID=94029 RepID=UPI002494A859|nr:uncharacterized protein LOC129958963 [Argiope bruennichi]